MPALDSRHLFNGWLEERAKNNRSGRRVKEEVERDFVSWTGARRSLQAKPTPPHDELAGRAPCRQKGLVPSLCSATPFGPSRIPTNQPTVFICRFPTQRSQSGLQVNQHNTYFSLQQRGLESGFRFSNESCRGGGRGRGNVCQHSPPRPCPAHQSSRRFCSMLLLLIASPSGQGPALLIYGAVHMDLSITILENYRKPALNLHMLY